MSTTIKEVARQAGVSIATVSRVFNNTGPVESKTRARVRAAATELRYIPNALGRNLSRRKSDAIGLLLPDLFGEFFSEVIRGADETAQSRGYHLLVSSSHSNRQEITAALKMMRGRVDALVIMSPHIDAQTLDANLPRNHPVTLLNCQVEDSSFDSLNIDNYGGAFSMVGHLLGHGHRKVAIVTGTPGNIDADERLRGYRDAILQAGCPLNEDYVIRGDFSESCGVQAVDRILSMDSPPTAVFASNDSMAIGLLGAFHSRGVAIPDQIALAGFDDVPVASFLAPPLTSVQVGIHHLGVLAIERVLEAVKHADGYKTTQTLLPARLSLRESCGCSRTHSSIHH